jgi:hypothetical protein
VHEVAGWQTRGADTLNPAGVVCHATAGATNSSTSGEISVIINGSATAPGPIAQLYLDRHGEYWLIAAGTCNHAGTGGAWGVQGNNRSIGIEAGNNNRGEPWTPAQLRSYVVGVAAILRRLGFDASRAVAHREWNAGPGGRRVKTDPVGIDMAWFRANVAAVLAGNPLEDDVDPIKIDPDISALTDGYLVAGRVEDPERFLQIIGWMAHRAQREATKATAQLGALLAAAGAEVQRDAADAVRDAELLAAVHAVQAGDPQVLADLLGTALTTELLDALHARLAG